jgi:cell volume regulation protein A
VTIIAILGAYLGADAVHASGFMAVFAAGVVVGNLETWGLESQEEHQILHSHVMENLSLLVRMLIFTLLGAQVDFRALGQYLVPGLVLLAVFLFVGRPLTVFLCAGPDRRARWNLKELLFLCWTRETGVIPAALVGLLAGYRTAEGSPLPGIDAVASVTFVLILGTLLLQAPTTGWWARKLGLLVEPRSPG